MKVVEAPLTLDENRNGINKVLYKDKENPQMERVRIADRKKLNSTQITITRNLLETNLTLLIRSMQLGKGAPFTHL